MNIDIDDFEVWAMRLSKAGYGSIIEIKNLNSETFLNLIHYENYLAQYQKVVMDMNRKD